MRSAWQDPPEFRGGPQLALPGVSPLIKRLLWINGGVFLFFFGFYVARQFDLVQPLYASLAINPELWRAWFPFFAPLWQLFTYGFLHSVSSPFHILFNLLGLYFFGTMLEGIVGSRRFLFSYLAAIVLGGTVQLLAFLPLTEGVTAEMALTGPSTPLTLGASGGVLFVIVASAVLRPKARVIFILFPITLKTLALILVGIDLFGVLTGQVGTAYAVHLTGAAYGFFAVRRRWIWADPRASWAERRRRASQQRRALDQERLDRLLQQIHHQGIQSLSRRDRDFLKRMSSGRD